MSDIRNLVNQMVSRYMGNSVQSPLTLPAVNDLSVGADEYARKHKPATGQLGLFEKPEERQKPLFSKKVDDEAGRWVTMRGARVYISSDDGRVLKGPKRLMGKTKEQIERESASAGNGEGAEKPPMPKGLAEMGRIRGGRKDNRQKGLFEEINPGFKWDEDEDVKSVSPKPSAVQLTRDEWDQKVRDEIRSIMGDADYENTDIDRRDGVDAIDDAFGFAHDNNRNYGDKIWALNDKWIDSMPEKEIKRSPAGKSEEADGEPFALSGAPSKSPVTPTDFGKADGATKQGALFDSGKGKGKDGKGDLPGQELLFNSDAGDVGNPRTMENRVQVAPRGPYEWKENKSGKKAWFKGETQITGAFVDDSWADEAARQLPADADSKPAPESDFKDHPEFERLQSVYGNLSNDEIKNKIDKMTGEIASLQKAGRREFNMNGGRRTSAAVSNEGARNVGQEKLLLGAYLKHREKNGVKDAALPAVNNTKTMKNRVQKKSKKSEPWQMSRSEYADSQRLSEPSPKEIEDKKKELELQVSTMRLSPDQAESTLKAFMNRHKGDDSISNFYHKKFVEKAIEKGQPVPAEVLADYPDLAGKTKQDDSGPQDGDRDATGLVFRDGRWHRDDEGEVEGEKQEAPSNSPAVNPFREKMDSLNRKADSLTPGGSSFDKQMASAFPLGVGRSGNASSRKTSKQAARRIDQSVNNALKSIEVRKKANALKGQAEAFDRGEIDEHGNRTELGRSKDAEQLAKSQEKKQAVASFWDDHSDWLKSTLQKGRKMAIAENPSNTVTVARINKTGITTDSGSKWMYRDLIPLGDDGKAMSPKDVISKVKEWKEKKQNPDKYSRHQLVAFANSLTDKYVRGEAGVVQIPVDKYAHPLVHAAVGGLGHMAVQSLVKNKTLRKLAHAAVASAMAAWMASANAGQAGQGQGPSSSPAVNQPAVSAPASPFARQQSGNRSIDAIVNQAFQNHQQAVAEAKAEKGIPADPGQAVPHSVSNTTGARAPGVKPLKGEDEPKSANPSTLPAGNGKSGDTAGKSEGFTDSEHPRHPAGAPESKGGEFAPKDGVESGSESPRNYPDNLNKPADQQTNYSPPERTIESLTGGGNDGDSPATDEPKSLEQKIAEHRMKLASQKSEPGPKASRRDNPDTSWKKAMNFGTERVQASKNAKSQERKARKQQEQQAKQQEQAVSFNPDQLEKESEASLVDGGAESDSPYDSKPNPEDFKREKDYQRALKAWKREKGAQRASITKKIAKSVVPEIAMEYELDHSELESAVNDAIAMESEGHKRQEEARRYVTDRGYNAGRINRNEDAGKDHSSTSLDEFASEWAGLYPEIAGSDESQWVDRMWNLAKAGKQDAPSAGDENFVRKVAERLHESRGQNSSPFPDDSESGSFAPIHGQIGDVDFTPFSRRSLVDSLNLIVDRYLRETIDNRYHVT